MKTRLASAFSRCRTFLRRWLRWTWLSRLPLEGPRPWQRAGLRPRRSVDELWPIFRPSLEVLETRWTPDDLFGPAASPVAVGGLVLLTGSRTTPLRLLFNSAPLPAAATPALPPEASADTGTPSRDPGAEEAFASGGVNDFAFLAALGQLPEPEYGSAPAREVGADELSLFTSLPDQKDTADPLSGSASARQGQALSPLSKAPLAAPDSPAKYASGGRGAGGSSTPNAGKGGGGPTGGGSLNLHLPSQNQLQQTNTDNNAATAAGPTVSMPLVPVNGIAAPPPAPAGTTASSTSPPPALSFAPAALQANHPSASTSDTTPNPATSSATAPSDNKTKANNPSASTSDTTPSSATSSAKTPSDNKNGTSSSLTATSNPSTYGQTVNFTARVSVVSPSSGTVAGLVEFENGSTVLDTAVLNSSGVATFTTAGLGVGVHDLTAVYEGNVDFVGSQASLTQSVNQAATSTSLDAFPNPSVFGQKVTLVATVADSGTPTAGPPTGQVIFENGGTNLGNAAVSNGAATFSTSGLPVGIDAITACYQGNNDFLASQGSTNQTVEKAASATTAASSSNPPASGQQVTYTATVQAVTPATGTPSPPMIPAFDPPSGGLPYPTPTTANQLYADFTYANANPAVAVDINLQAGTTYSLSAIGTQLLDQSTAGITINGNGATISAAGSNNRIFQVDPGYMLSLNSLTVTGGTVSAASAQGGGIADTGGSLTLSDVKVTNNKAEGSLGTGQGGGIYVKGGSLTLKNGCTIGGADVSNQATGGSVSTHTGQSITAAGGGIYVSGGVVNITSSTISNNVAKGKDANGTYKSVSGISFGKGGGGAAGGGLYVNGTSWTVTVTESTVTSNSALGGKGASTGLLSHFKNGHGGNAYGGGIYASGSGTFHLLSTSLSSNKAQGGSNGGTSNNYGDVIDGGGIAAGGGMYFLGSASLTIQASGFEANNVTGGAGVISGDAFGGGLAIGPVAGGSGGGSGGPVTIQQSSFDGNTALGGGPGFGGTSNESNTGGDPAGGGLYLNSGTVTITNSSVTKNVAQGGIGNTGGSAAGGGIVSDTGVNNLTLINTTLGTNKAQGGNSTSVSGALAGNAEGGGLYVYSSSTLINDTIAFNIALSGTLGQSPSFGGGIEDEAFAPPVTLTNVILESNTIGTAGTAGSISDVSGSVSNSSGYDFISNTTGISNASSLNSLPEMILNNTTPQLGTLTTVDSAPSLSYYPLLTNSTVRNTGTTSVVGTIAAAEGVTLSAATDEIGDPRTISNEIDMGAIEEAVTPTVIPSATSATLNPLTATQGVAYSGTVLSSLSDPDSNVLYSETINWGDGTTPSFQSIGSASPPPSLPTLSHVYSLGGDYEVTDTLVANRGGTSTTVVLTTTATVLPEMAVQADNLTASSCQTLTSVTVGTFQVPADSTQSDYTATVDWGDGTGEQTATLQSTGSGSFNVVGTHAYHLGGTFLTDVRVTDLSGTVVDAFGTVTVTPTTPAPDPALTVYDIHATQGVVSSDMVATFTTADTALASGAFAALIDWGDGTPQTAGTISGSAGSFTVSAAHTYTTVGLHEVQVAVTSPTGSGRGGATAEVGEAATISLTSQSLTLTANVSGSDELLATATGLPAGTYSAKVDWGDSTAGTVGTAAMVTGSAGTLWLAGSHSYTNPGDYVARVRLYDANGNSLATVYDPVTVTNLAEGTAGGDNFAWFQVMPPVLDQASLYSATINWGDSTSSTATMVSDGEYFSISQGTHDYAAEGTYTQQVTLSTSGGTSLASIQRTEVVADAPLTNASPPPSPLQGTLGTTFTAVPVASFNDADPNAVASDFTATIDWGDGVASTGSVSLTGSVFKVEGTHSYAAAADYTVSVLIKDNGGASLVSTLSATVTPVVTLSDHTLSDDPSRALLLPSSELTIDLNQGAVRISEPLDFDASPGTTIGGNPALVYNSATADGQAILQLYLNSTVVPQSATFTVTWEGTTLASIPWTPSGQTGPTYVIDLPISPTVAASGVYNWTVQANMVYAGGSTTAEPLNGQTSVVVNTASPYGAGWGLQSTSRLVFTPTGNVLMVYGDGDSRLFTRNLNLDGTFTSPAEDFGTLSGGLCQGNYLYTDPHDVQYTYDLNGRLTQIVQPNGFTTSYSYTSGLLSKVTAPDSGTTTLSYDSNELLTTINEPGTRTVSITYLALNQGGYNVNSITDAADFFRSFDYSTAGPHLLANDDANSGWDTFVYYSNLGLLNEVVEGTSPDTATYTITSANSALLVNPNDQPLAQMIDGVGNTTTYLLDPRGRELAETQPDGSTATWQRDGAGDATHYADFNGLSTQYSYDSNGNLTQVLYPNGTSQNYNYDGKPFNEVTQSIDPAGNTTSMQYDPEGELTLQTIGYGSPQAATSSYTWSGGLMRTMTDPNNNETSYTYSGFLLASQTLYNASGLAVNSQSYTYDSAGNPATTVDSDKGTTQYYYDGDNNLVQTTDPDGITISQAYTAYGTPYLTIDGRGTSTYYDFDSLEQPELQITALNTPQAELTFYDYNAAGRLTMTVDPAGNSTSYAYDSDGDQTLVVQALGTPQQSSTVNEYDHDGNLTQSIDADHNTTSYQYDAVGNETLMIQGVVGTSALSTTSMAYDGDGNLLLQTIGFNTTDAEATSYAYDSNGNQTLQIAGYGSAKPETTGSFYDGDGNLTQQVDGDTNTSTFLYDALGDQTQSVVGNTTTKDSYDGNGNLTLAVDAAGHSTSYLYDADGNETLMIQGYGTASASTTSMAYDGDGNETLAVQGKGTTAVESSFYAFDRNGNQTEVITGYNSGRSETTAMAYDGDNNLTQQVDGAGNTSTFALDALEDQTQSVVGTATTRDSYDGDGNLTLAVDAAGHSTSYQFDAAGNETLMIQGLNSNAASSTTYGYDAADNETLVVVGLGTTAAASSFYAYDANGNQTQVITGYNSGKPETTTMQYDGDNNLTEQVDGDLHTSTFAYDALGDQTQSVVGNATTKDSYDGDGNLTLAVDGAGHSTSYLYDAVGNETLMIQGVNSNAVSSTSYGFDAAGNQSLLVLGLNSSNPESTSYGYDANANQTLQITGYQSSKPESTSSFYDADNNLTEQVDGAENTSTYLYDALGDQTQSIVGTATTRDSYDGDGNLTLAVDAAGHSTSYQYDAAGNETLMIQGYGTSAVSSTTYGYDAADNETLVVVGLGTTAAASSFYAYDANGNQTQVITGYHSGKPETTTMQYDGDNNVTEQVDGNTNTSTFAYDALGDQTQSVIGNATTRDSYDGDGNLTLAVDAAGHSTSYLYDADGKETLMIQGYGTSAVSSTTYDYDASGNQTLVVVGYGTYAAESTSYAYDANANQTLQITGLNSPLPDTTVSAYDGDGQLTQQIDPNLNTSSFLYDALGDQTQAIVGGGTTKESYDGDGNLTLAVDANGNSTSYQYDADGRETLMIQGYGTGVVSSTTYGYDAAGNQTLAVTGLNSSNPESTSYSYDANGNQTLQITGYGSSKPESTSSFYDADNNLTQQVDGALHTSTFLYDALGDQKESILGNATTNNSYDGDGEMTLSVDAVGNSTSYQYDADGNETMMIQGYGTSAVSSTSYRYDVDGNQIWLITGLNSSTPQSTYYGYDAQGHKTLEIDGYTSGSATSIRYLYDADGNKTVEIDGYNSSTPVTTRYLYDANGNKTLEIDGYNSSTPVSTRYLYDADGNKTVEIDGYGTSSAATTRYVYDATGKEDQEIDGYGSGSTAATIDYLYDASGNQTREIDPVGNTTSFQYDADGEQTLMIQAYGTTSAVSYSYQYDNDGNLTSQTNPNGTSIASSYDIDGNLTSQLWYAGGSLSNSLRYTYDGDGHILTAGNDAGSYEFAYNADGEQTQVITPSSVTLTYLYDTDGDVTQIADSLGDTVTSQYDANDHLVQRNATGPGGAQADVSLAYDTDNNLTSITRQGQVSGVLQTVGSSSYAYDAQGDTTSIVHKNASGSTLDSFGYSYNAADQVTQEVDFNGTTTNYAYDATGQLTSAGTASYSYDANGNPKNNSGYTIGANNELTSDGTWNYDYDANGNQTEKIGVSGGPDAGLTWTYTYDDINELLSASETNSQSQNLEQADFTYDDFGNISQSSISTNGGSAVVTNYVYNDNTLLLSLTASNSPQTLYVGGAQPDQFFFQIDASNGTYFYLNDKLNSVRDEMNTSSQDVDELTYNAYGENTNQTNPSLSPAIGFAGYQTFAALGLDVAGRRMYDPQSEQWLQQDSILTTAGPNTREYVNDDPTNETDPTGQEAEPQTGILGSSYAKLDEVHRDMVRQKLTAEGMLYDSSQTKALLEPLQQQALDISNRISGLIAPRPQQPWTGTNGMMGGGPYGGSPLGSINSLRPAASGSTSSAMGTGMRGMMGSLASIPSYPSEKEYTAKMGTYAAKALPIFQRALQAYLKEQLAKPPAELARALAQPLPMSSIAEKVINELGEPPISSNKAQASQDVWIAVQAEGARQIQRKAAAAAEKERQRAQAIASMPRQEIIPAPGTVLYDNMIQERIEQRRQMMRRAGVSELYIWGEFILPGGSFDQMMETLAPLAAAVETRNNIRATVEGNRPLPPVAAEVRPVAGSAGIVGPMGGRAGLRPGSPGSVPTLGETFLATMASAAATPEQARKIAELMDQTRALMAGAKTQFPAEAQMNLHAPKEEDLANAQELRERLGKVLQENGVNLKEQDFFVLGTSSKALRDPDALKHSGHGTLHMTSDMNVLRAFGIRNVGRFGGGEVAGILLIINHKTFQKLEEEGLALNTRMGDVPGPQTEFFPASAQTLNEQGKWIELPPSFFKKGN